MYAVIFDTRNSANVRLCVSRGHSSHLPPPSPISPFPSKLSPSWDEIKEDVTINSVTACETNRTASAEQKRLARKARASNAPADAPLLPCPKCHRTFRTRIGLFNYIRTHGQPDERTKSIGYHSVHRII